MHCELVVPGLFSANTASRFGALEVLLARGRSRSGPAQRFEDWLREAFDLGEGPFPAGALTVLACGGDPRAQSWTRADPVHLRVMRDHLAVLPADAFDLPAEEAETLCDALSQHFAGRAVFRTCGPKRWCAGLSGTPAIEAGNPLEAAGREVELPGETAPLLNEAQMVLHAHPVNEAREARGEPAVNSIWLWGGGRAAGATSRWQSIAADDPAVIGAARLAGARHRALPRSARDWLDRLPEDGRHLAVLDTLRANPESPVLQQLEKGWFEPLLGALRAGRIGMVTVHVPDAAEALSFETIRADLRRFWRMAKPIERYA